MFFFLIFPHISGWYSFSAHYEGRESSLTGLETIPEQRAQPYDEYGRPIVMDEAYRKALVCFIYKHSNLRTLLTH